MTFHKLAEQVGIRIIWNGIAPVMLVPDSPAAKLVQMRLNDNQEAVIAECRAKASRMMQALSMEASR